MQKVNIKNEKYRFFYKEGSYLEPWVGVVCDVLSENRYWRPVCDYRILKHIYEVFYAK